MIVDVPGVRVGHWDDPVALTGCTVVLPPPGARASVAVLGGAPATHETDVVRPGTRVQEVHGIVLTGGSAFGLSAAFGVMRWLERQGIGWPTPFGVVPIVPAVSIYDFLIGDPSVRPGPDEGEAACEAASAGERREGNVGAGMGATCGKSAGFEHMSRGGIGGSSATEGELIVGVLAVVNAVGDVVDTDGSIIAGARAEPVYDPALLQRPDQQITSTTNAVVATNADLTKEELARVAAMAGGGLARAIVPVHTMFDGDTVFAVSTRTLPSPVELVGRLAADVIADACRRAVRAATDAGGVPARGTRERGVGR